MTQLERAVVAGGAGAVGEGIVRAFAGAGVEVIVPSRSAERLERLLGRLEPPIAGRVVGEVVQTDDLAALEAWRDRLVAQRGRVDAVVASLGGWFQGEPLAGMTEEVFRRALEDGLLAHFRMARAWVPHLSGHPSSYTFVNGFSARVPYPLAAPVSVSAAGQLMLASAFAAELSERPVRVNALVLGPVVTRARTHGQPEWLNAGEVGRFALALARAGEARGEVFSLLNRAELEAALRGLGA
jgi:3-oxoacyl-[acyl-carrier protein] reductase